MSVERSPRRVPPSPIGPRPRTSSPMPYQQNPTPLITQTASECDTTISSFTSSTNPTTTGWMNTWQVELLNLKNSVRDHVELTRGLKEPCSRLEQLSVTIETTMRRLEGAIYNDHASRETLLWQHREEAVHAQNTVRTLTQTVEALETKLAGRNYAHGGEAVDVMTRLLDDLHGGETPSMVDARSGVRGLAIDLEERVRTLDDEFRQVSAHLSDMQLQQTSFEKLIERLLEENRQLRVATMLKQLGTTPVVLDNSNNNVITQKTSTTPLRFHRQQQTPRSSSGGSPSTTARQMYRRSQSMGARPAWNNSTILQRGRSPPPVEAAKVSTLSSPSQIPLPPPSFMPPSVANRKVVASVAMSANTQRRHPEASHHRKQITAAGAVSSTSSSKSKETCPPPPPPQQQQTYRSNRIQSKGTDVPSSATLFRAKSAPRVFIGKI
eukprot:PhM_4_TR11259/c0_g1_i1/m.96238